MRTCGDWSSSSPRYSRVDGSAQCRSSHTTSTGWRSASSSIQATRASCVCCFCCCGVRRTAAYRSSGSGTESSAANSGTTSSRGRRYVRSVRSSLSSFAAGVSSRCTLEDPLHMLNHRIERTVGVIRRTPNRHARKALAAHLGPQGLHQGRFANTGLAPDQHHLSEPRFTLLPAPSQQPQFLVPPHQEDGAAGCGRLLIVSGVG